MKLLLRRTLVLQMLWAAVRFKVVACSRVVHIHQQTSNREPTVEVCDATTVQ
jgi:hypothetical protein